MIWVAIDSYDAGYAIKGLMIDEQHASGQRPGYGGGWVIRDDVHEWLTSRTDSYQLVWSEIKHGFWHVGLEDSNMAMLFKLTWV